MLSDFVPLKTRSTRDRSIPRSLQRRVSTKSSISQLSFFNFSNVRRHILWSKMVVTQNVHILWSKMVVTQNVHTGRPPNALPSSTVILYVALLPYSRLFPLYRTLCKLRRTSVDGSINRCCFLFCHFLSRRPVSAAFLTPNSSFFDECRASISYWHFVNSGPYNPHS